MKMIGWFNFPTTTQEAKEYEPSTVRHALASNVLCVAQTRIEEAWSAYVAVVPGLNHLDEEDDVLAHGTKLSERVARAIFAEAFDGLPYHQ